MNESDHLHLVRESPPGMYEGGCVFEQWCSFCRQVVYLVHLNAPRLDVLPPHTERIVNEETGVTATIRRAHPPKRKYTKRKGSWKSHRVSAATTVTEFVPDKPKLPREPAKEPALKAAGEICPRCGLSFQNSQGLKHHITSKHGGSPPGRVASGSGGSGAATRKPADGASSTTGPRPPT